MLIKFGTEANNIIEDALTGSTRYPRNAINTAMATRMRTIELIGKAVGVLDAGPRQIKQELNVVLPKDVQRQMLETAVRQLETPAREALANTSIDTIEADAEPEPEPASSEPSSK